MDVPLSLKSRRKLPDERVPTRWGTATHRLKATALQVRRSVVDLRKRIARHAIQPQDGFTHRLAENRSPLFTTQSALERRLELGKIQNLRRAARALDGIVIPAGEIFSSWRQVGRTTRRRGYVEGRQLLEGCLVPALGGGICQLTNALYGAALDAGLEIVERHPHSRVIPGSAAERDRDATVAWNYLDLRFRARETVRLTVRLTTTDLIVQLHSASAPNSQRRELSLVAATPRNTLGSLDHSCDTCGVSECFRHRKSATVPGLTAFIVDECWPEFAEYLSAMAQPEDLLCLPLDGNRWRKPNYAWPTASFASVRTATAQTLLRAYRSRRLGRYGAARLSAQLDDARRLAQSLSRSLPSEVTRVVVSQTLLPFLWEEDHLGGREVEVLLSRTPLLPLHDTLDALADRYPESATLVEFRAPAEVLGWETDALAAASRVVTPHRHLAAQFSSRVEILEWRPARTIAWTPGDAIAFPGPTAARKGAYEVRELARALDLEIVLYGSNLEGDGFWNGLRTRQGTPGNLDGIRAVVQPSYLEERPRSLLSALAAGVPVIATEECGLPQQPGLRVVQSGDVSALSQSWLGERESQAFGVKKLDT